MPMTSQVPSPLVSMRAIRKAFSGVPALSDASLEIGRGEVMALVGQNGAGKSTMIKILTGAYRRDGGEILFDGSPVDFTTPHAAQDAGISTIYQEINLVPLRSVAENVFLGREPRRFGLVDWPRLNDEAAAILRRFRIDVDVRRPLGVFNAATRQMVAIARAVSRRAKLVIMDEPTSSLDERETSVLFEVIRTLREDGVSVLFVTHRLDELYAVCDRVTIMRDGRTVGVSAMVEISKLDLVVAMLGKHVAQLAEREPVTIPQDVVPLADISHLAAGRKVRDVSLSIRPGEILGLAGLLGSGRTETARVLFGADRPDAGEIRIDGRAAHFREPIDAIRAGLGFCTEDRKIEGIVPEMSVRENLTLALLPRLTRSGIVDEARQRAIVDDFMKRLGVKAASADQRIRELSGGNQQKVLLARWLCMNPRLLIVDEPTRGIDVGAKAEILRLVRDLAAQGLGVLMISSEIEEILSVADRIEVLSDGRTSATLTREEASEDRIMQAMAHDPAAVAKDEAGDVV
jgi:galactofuranose transport system ATP-binding protein